MTRKILKVNEMSCPACVMRLESIEDELPGIYRIDASYHRQEMVVEFDESLVTMAQILQAVEQKGYHPLIKET